MPTRNCAACIAPDRKDVLTGLDHGADSSNCCATCKTAPASEAVKANTLMQSSVRQAGTTPELLNRPQLGFRPIRLLNAAGIRPEPAVSVPNAKLANPSATASAEPELEPPEI